MMSILGRTLVLLALATCAVGAPLAYVAGARRSEAGLRIARRLALLFGVVMLLATLVMEIALVRHDFSVSYVAQVGSLATPLHITIVSLWSSLDGSILFWGLVLGGFTALFAILQKRGHDDYMAYTLGTLFVIGAYFTFLIAGPANPFEPTPAPIPTDGPGPNPLLQNHLLMIIHPPMLYLGYVGMSVPFAMAVAALLRGSLGATWLRPLRNWLLVPCAFLSLGIMLGGWWSYEVLGWGGYWAWDPVENASLLPWLTGIAALHSAIVLQRRGTLRAWTILLIFVTFLLTILGTFLTRSGVVNSVHSFTQSPIGPMFLGFLGVALLGSVLLLAMRVDKVASEPGEEHLLGREGAFLLNNLLLVAFMLTVLIGTLFPIVAEAVRGVKVSVGEPFYNRMTVPLSFGLLFLLGLGPALPWGQATRREMQQALLWPLPAAAAALGLALALGARDWHVLLTAALAGYTLWITARQFSRPARQRRASGAGWGSSVADSLRKAPRWYGAYVSHLGVVMTFLAIAISSTFQVSREAHLRPGEQATIGDYALVLDRVERVEQDHRTSERAVLKILRHGRPDGTLEPAMNFYPTQREPVGSPSVRSRLSHDLYVTLMSVEPGGAAGIRAIVTPAVGWIWIGSIVLFFGMMLCLAEARREAVRGSTS